jgi:replication factor C large subunit
MGWDVMELNASDSRTKDQIEKVAGGAAMNQSLTNNGRQLVILDEADNLHRHKDRGGAGAMTRLVKSANQPIVLIANDFYDMSRGLRGACRDIEFRDVSARSILPALRDICRREDIQYDDAALERIADRNAGDLRGAINDLQAVGEGRDRLTIEHISTGSRDRSVGIFEFLDSVLKEENAQEALQVAYDAEENPEDLLQWIEDKVPMVYGDGELADAYEFISNADRWQGRVRATQNYQYWRYISDNISAGVASVRQSQRGGWTRYGGYPYRSSKDATRDHIAQQIAEAEGVSIATARREYLPYLASMIAYCKPSELTTAIAARYNLDAEHVAYISGSGKSTNKVQNIVEEAEQLREQQAVEHSGEAFAPGESESESESDGDGVAVDVQSPTNATNDEDAEQVPVSSNDASTATDSSGELTAEEDEDDDQQSGLSDFM